MYISHIQPLRSSPKLHNFRPPAAAPPRWRPWPRAEACAAVPDQPRGLHPPVLLYRRLPKVGTWMYDDLCIMHRQASKAVGSSSSEAVAEAPRRRSAVQSWRMKTCLKMGYMRTCVAIILIYVRIAYIYIYTDIYLCKYMCIHLYIYPDIYLYTYRYAHPRTYIST